MEFSGFIYRVYAVSKAGGDTAEVFITDRLNGGRTGQQLLLILYKTVDVGLSF